MMYENEKDVSIGVMLTRTSHLRLTYAEQSAVLYWLYYVSSLIIICYLNYIHLILFLLIYALIISVKQIIKEKTFMEEYKLENLIKQIQESKQDNSELFLNIEKENDEIKQNTKINNNDCRYIADGKVFQEYIRYDSFNDKNYVYFISTLINSFYSTRMGADRLYATAMMLAENGKNVEKLLKQEQPLSDEQLDMVKNTLSQELCLRDAELNLRGEESRSFRSYSFVTKFLAIHSKYRKNGEYISLFPIYDGQVKLVIKKYKLNKIEILKKFVESFNFSTSKEWLSFNQYCKDNNIKNIHLDDYTQFYKLMNILSSSTELNLSQIDRLFWKLGDKIKREEKEK